ncbi:MAG: PEP-CTERM sorting domain-containing protein [Akkermansia sp.]
MISFFSKILTLALLCPVICYTTQHAQAAQKTYGIFDCNFLDQGSSDKVSDSTISSDSSWTDSQMACVERALNTWQNLLGNKSTRQLKALFSWSSNLGDNVLGGSTSPYNFWDSEPNLPSYQFMNTVELAWREGNNDNQLLPEDYDIVVQFATPYIDQFNFDIAAPSVDQMDFQSIMTHEIGHNIGFFSTVQPTQNADGTATGLGAFPLELDGKPLYSAFDMQMNIQKDPPGTTATKSIKLGDTISIGNQGLTVYNPETWAEGSSMIHIDTSHDPNALMQYNIGNGVVRREPSSKELALLSDMGWKIVPEPSTGMLVLLSSSFLLLRRRRQQTV